MLDGHRRSETRRHLESLGGNYGPDVSRALRGRDRCVAPGGACFSCRSRGARRASRGRWYEMNRPAHPRDRALFDRIDAVLEDYERWLAAQSRRDGIT